MTDLERLTATLDALNVHYTQDARERTETPFGVNEARINVTLEEPKKDQTKVPYSGYNGFVWVFTFDMDGTLREVGGYE